MANVRRALALLLIACACGGRKPPATAPAPDHGQKTYAPLAFKADAKLPTQAVILGTDESSGSTVMQLPAVPGTVRVDAMFVKRGGGPGQLTRGLTPISLGTAPGDGTAHVAIAGAGSSEAGPQWRASVWASAFVAARTLGKDLGDLQFTAAPAGYIDGTSASGLIAGGFLATITGAPIAPSVTLTGIVHPDGTVGPVAGLPEKLAGAIANGKQRVGYPIGMRWAKSAATGRLVDVVELARDAGGEAIEVANVHGAYQVLTGQHLPEPVPVGVQDMALDRETSARIDAKYKAWQQRLAGEWAALLQLQQAGRLPQILTLLSAHAQAGALDAQKLHGQGLLYAAYRRMVSAWVYASAANATYDVLAKVQADDVGAAALALAALEPGEQAAADVLEQIGAIEPATLGDHLRMIGAFEAALRGRGFQELATAQLAASKLYVQGLAGASRTELASPELAEQIVGNVAPSVVLIARAVAATTHAAQRLELELGSSIAYTCSIPDVQRLATSFQSAAAAGVGHVETLLVAPLAQRTGVPLETARTRIAIGEPDLLVAANLSRPPAEALPSQLEERWGTHALAWNLLRLAGSRLAYHETAVLIAKYDSLEVRGDAIHRVTAVAHPKAFQAMLANAERAARSNARAARIATGTIPVQARLAYQLATVQRAGDTQDQLDALTGFWTSSAWSQTAVMLARN